MAVGSGAANTADILAAYQQYPTQCAALTCIPTGNFDNPLAADLVDNDRYSAVDDGYLPSKDELSTLFLKKRLLMGFLKAVITGVQAKFLMIALGHSGVMERRLLM